MARRVHHRSIVAATLVVATAVITAGCTSPTSDAAGGSTAPATGSPATVPWRDQRVDLGGYAVQVRCAGDGPKTVVFVAGLGQSAADAWSASGVPEALAADARVCVYDRPGLGASDPAPAGRERSVPAQVEELERLIDNGAFPVPDVLVGQGYGTFIARQVAKDRLRAVTGLVLVDPPLEPLDPTPPPGATPGQVAEYAGIDELNADLGAYGAGALPPPPVPTVVLGAGDLPALPADAPEALATTTGTAAPAAGAGDHRRELQRQLAQKGAFGSYRTIADAGSLVQWWRPEAVADAVRAVLADTRAGR